MSPASVPSRITSFADLQQQQAGILISINNVPKGAELFVADPFRFLGENGFVASPEAQADLLRRAPARASAPKQLYDGIKTGSAVLAGNQHLHVSVRIRSLAVPGEKQ
jgi:hypothetical protein